MGRMDIKIKVQPEDFIVQESQSILISLSDRNMEYTVISLGKKGYTTFEAISLMSDFFDIEQSLLGYAGLKDEDGVTYQFVSIPINIRISDRIQEFNEQYKGDDKFISVIVIGYSDKRIRIGKLQGNAFKIRLRNVPENVAKNLRVGVRSRVVFPNYYDTQRFGLPNMPKRTHLIGEALYNEKFDLAMEHMKEGTPEDYKGSENFSDNKSFFNSMNRSKLSFYYNAFTSNMYNSFLRERIKENMQCVDRCYDGIEYAMPKNGNHLTRLGDDLEKICVPRYDIDKNMELTLKYYYRYSYIDTIIHINAIDEDTVFERMNSICVDFFLPSGCYATMAIKQFLCNLEYQAG